MPMFRITRTQVTTEFYMMNVEAPTAYEAEELAEETLDAGYDDGGWWLNNTRCEDYTSSVEEVKS